VLNWRSGLIVEITILPSVGAVLRSVPILFRDRVDPLFGACSFPLHLSPSAFPPPTAIYRKGFTLNGIKTTWLYPFPQFLRVVSRTKQSMLKRRCSMQCQSTEVDPSFSRLLALLRLNSYVYHLLNIISRSLIGAGKESVRYLEITKAVSCQLTGGGLHKDSHRSRFSLDVHHPVLPTSITLPALSRLC
jgi:hypothetical protein